MIEETGTSGYDRTEQIPATEVTVSRGIVRRSREDEDVTTSGASKRRKFDSDSQHEEEENDFQLRYRSRCDDDVNFDQNVVSTTVCGASDHHHVDSVFTCSINDGSISDLKTECVSVTDNLISTNDSFSRDTSTSSVVCFESEEMESLSTVTVNKKKPTVVIEATSRRKQPSPAVTMPSAAELEEFFSKAEKYEQKRFAEKYNFDIVKDVPMEGRYQWVPLNP